jgi:hypothetical protein
MLDVYSIPLPVRVRSRVIDIWLHSSPTLSAPTDSQYLLLSAEKNLRRKRVIGVVGVVGGSRIAPSSNSIPFFPFFLISSYSILYFNKHLGNKKKTASGIRRD